MCGVVECLNAFTATQPPPFSQQTSHCSGKCFVGNAEVWMCSYAVVVSKNDIISVTCNSLMYEMRVKVHFELAKISAQSQQLQAALDHLNKVQ